MPRIVAFVLAVFGSLYVQGQACAQLTPPAGSAGAGSSAISGVPFGPANPRVLSDPSGVGNAKPTAAPQQHPSTNGLPDTVVIHSCCHAALPDRVTADHRHTRCRAQEQGTASPPDSPPGLHFHRDLPGLLAHAQASRCQFVMCAACVGP